jgi:sugar transferase EpsL
MTKRCLDIVAALLLLVLLSPVLLVVALLVRGRLGTPVLFRQRRAGLGGEPFFVCKFRSMTDARGPDGQWLPDEERLTPFGLFLRKYSLDELPQLLNVLRGELSLVGPRPLYVEYVPLYSAEQARRLDVRPGITGWAQINGRNSISWEERFALDVWYVEHRSLWLDLKILALTVHRVLTKQGISAEGHATMPYFTGSTPNERKEVAT